jgi:protein-disulfide isomerase
VNHSNREGKRAARERLREQRESQARRDRRRRALIAGGIVVGVLAIAGGIAALVASAGGDGGGGDGRPSAAPVGATGGNELVIPSGAVGAPSTLTVYEDFRCPACGYFEKTFRDTVRQLEDSGLLKADYHLVRIIDGNLGGTGSRNAANAAACAQDQRKFRAYHDVLYHNQPEESQDRFADKRYLIRLAGQVKGLRTAAFTDCVNSGTYDDWVEKSNAAFGSSGYNATPTILLNGTDVYSDPKNPLTPAKLKQQVTKAGKGRKPGGSTPAP